MKPILILIVFLPLIYLFACSSSKGKPSDWITTEDPGGFSFAHPVGWAAVVGEDGMIQIRYGDAVILVQPFFDFRKAMADSWVNNVPQLFAQILPGLTIGNIKRIKSNPDEVYADFSFSLNGAKGAGSVLCSMYRGSGIFYLIASRQESFTADRKIMTAILKTFTFSQAAANKPTGGTRLEYKTWQDPRENAFSVEVPAGWNVDGGLFRFASVDIRSAIVLWTPDTDIYLSAGDAEIPPFTVPNQMLAMTGFNEGSWYSPGYGVNMMVKRYLGGADFAKEYVNRKLHAGGYGDITFSTAKNRPDVSGAINEISKRYAVYGIQSLLDTGEVTFDCTKGGKNYTGYYFAGTRLTSGYGGGTWNVEHLIGFLAEKSRVSLAREVLAHLVKSFRLSPRWAAMQSNLTAKTSEIITQTNNEISTIISSTYSYRQQVNDEASRKWSNAMLGLTDVKDPATGETWKTASGHNYYWKKGDTLIGTDTYERPDIDFTPLQEW